MIGQSVRLLVPNPYGSYQLNEVQGLVISIPSSDEIEIQVDSSQNVNAYIPSPTTNLVCQVVAVGDINSGNVNSTGRIDNITFIPGSFIDISPN